MQLAAVQVLAAWPSSILAYCLHDYASGIRDDVYSKMFSTHFLSEYHCFPTIFPLIIRKNPEKHTPIMKVVPCIIIYEVMQTSNGAYTTSLE